MTHDSKSPAQLVAELIDLLDVRPGEAPDNFLGPRKIGGVGRVFGGQIIAQALVAAARTVDPEKQIHSLHAYFLRGGSEDHEAEYRVTRDFDGRSFATRRVAAIQQDEIILNFAASFQRREDGLSHQDPMPDAPQPETLRSEAEIRAEMHDRIPEAMRAVFMRPRPIEFRPTSPRAWFNDGPMPAFQQSWLRIPAPLGDDPILHRAMLAWASDMALLGTCIMPHGLSWLRGEINSASLDHVLWFHDDFRADDWLLYTSTSPWSGAGRGLNHGTFHTRDGRLVASVAQEGMIRKRRV